MNERRSLDGLEYIFFFDLALVTRLGRIKYIATAAVDVEELGGIDDDLVDW